MADEAVTLPLPAIHARLSRQQISGFWGAWAGWTLDGMDSVIYALVLSPALTELLLKSGVQGHSCQSGVRWIDAVRALPRRMGTIVNLGADG